MVYGAILASGKGTRMNSNSDIPKQFMEIDEIPIVIYTIKSMLNVNRFDVLYLAVPFEFLDYSKELIYRYIGNIHNIRIVSGGTDRIDTISNVINNIKNSSIIYDDDIIVIHDGVRPFVTEKILNDSIDAANKYGAVVAAVPISDTLIISSDGSKVNEIPKRDLYYKGQSPDSFRLKLFIDLFDRLTLTDKEKITGTSQVCTFNNYPIYMIPGDEINFKITTSSDFDIAKKIIKGR